MAHKRTATLLYTTEENLTVPEFFAVGRPPTAVLLCAVKGGISMPQTKNICDFQGSSEPIFLAQFFIGHLTLSGSAPLHHYRYSSALLQISASIFSAASLLSALTEIYILSFGSVPEGRTTMEQLSSRRNLRTSDFGRPSRPRL